jgi:hypothetical protein
MSAANAAARKRRAAPDNNSSAVSRPNQIGSQPNTPSSQTSSQTNGLTIHQVITLIDSRLIKLENFVKESSGKNTSISNGPISNQPKNRELEITNNDIVFQEVDRRFEILATEINNLKDMMLKLQTFTMEVNKTLMEERVRVFSDIGHITSNPANNTIDNFFLSDNMMNDKQEMTSIDLRNLADEELNK